MQHTKLMRQLASYNEWMNVKIYAAARKLPTAELLADKGAFFGSILRTLNHLIIADTIWLRRFAAHPAQYAVLAGLLELPAPDFNDLQRFSDLPSIAEHRAWLDRRILEWTAAMVEADFEIILRYTNSRGEPFNKSFLVLLMHFFNHQTHHRGQVTTLLSQAGIDVGVTDLIALIPDDASGDNESG